MVLLRSHLFNALFYLVTIVMLIGGLPLFVSRRGTIRLAQAWGRVELRLLAAICGTRLEVRGREHIPSGAAMIAAKHQSFLETFALVALVHDPVFILKRELTFIPLFGWCLMRSGMVPVDRAKGSRAMPEMNRRAARAVHGGRQLIIFSEGTRRAAGAPPAHKHGVAHLYSRLGVPCVPVALNSGLYWPRRSVLRRPGTVVIEFLPPIPPGLPRETFFAQVQARIETASDALLAEGRAELGQAPALAPSA